LSAYRGRADVVVLGLARGGVPVGWEVAAGLGVPLDVFLVRKLGVPQWPELAMGAIASGGAVVINESVELRAKVVILVDDGIATGASMRSALQAVRTAAPSRVVVAVPVAPRRECRRLRPEADDVVCAACPINFAAVGQVFDDFHQVTDDEVRALLHTPTMT
jgi:putative phosphoribosyl transferase